jgi:hypothetical protein
VLLQGSSTFHEGADAEQWSHWGLKQQQQQQQQQQPWRRD